MKKVMAFGTFDMFHPGLKHYLSEAKKQGDMLIVIVARDTTVQEVKGKIPRDSETIRRQNVEEFKEVNVALLGSLGNYYEIISQEKPDVLCFGYDQRSFNNEKLKKYLQSHNLNPDIYISSAFEPEKWKSSKL